MLKNFLIIAQAWITWTGHEDKETSKHLRHGEEIKFFACGLIILLQETSSAILTMIRLGIMAYVNFKYKIINLQTSEWYHILEITTFTITIITTLVGTTNIYELHRNSYVRQTKEYIWNFNRIWFGKFIGEGNNFRFVMIHGGIHSKFSKQEQNFKLCH